jgi:hypothetical protein
MGLLFFRTSQWFNGELLKIYADILHKNTIPYKNNRLRSFSWVNTKRGLTSVAVKDFTGRKMSMMLVE